MSVSFTILGCGSSGGVPRLGQGWGDCDPLNPKNRRRRCSLLVERSQGVDTTRVLVDTSPDMREQLLGEGVNWVDGVLFTHEHADHTHGIDDLRPMAIHKRRRVDVYMDDVTEAVLRTRFDYCFATPPGSEYPPILEAHRFEHGVKVQVNGLGGPVETVPFRQHHGDITSYGFRFGGLAYSSDLHDLPDESLPYLANLDLWIVDALRPAQHPSHFSLSDAMGWIERLKPKRAVLTNMHTDLDYETLRRSLPEHVVPGFDGMKLVIS